MTALMLSEMYIYPIKSAAGIALHEARMTSRGLEYDRRWMVVTPGEVYESAAVSEDGFDFGGDRRSTKHKCAGNG